MPITTTYPITNRDTMKKLLSALACAWMLSPAFAQGSADPAVVLPRLLACTHDASEAARVAAPVLCVVGSDDDLSPPGSVLAMASLLPDAEVAENLYVSPRTVSGHLRTAYRKLGVKSRTAAVKKAGELGLI